MYYYIFDIKKCKKRSVVSDIKNYLSFLGISGEFTYPSSAYSVAELVSLGLSKKYNTIVGIGDDEIANQIAASLYGKSEAMGLIPIEATETLANLIGTRSWKEAADSLRYRRIAEMKIGLIANGGAFLTEVDINAKNPVEVTLEFKDYLLQAKVRDLKISNFNPSIKKISPDHLDISFHSVGLKDRPLFTKLTSMFSNHQDETDFSLFRARSLRVFTSSQIPIFSGGHQIAKTPQLIESSDDYLRLIVGKKSSLS